MRDSIGSLYIHGKDTDMITEGLRPTFVVNLDGKLTL
jgi:hypothetical protein